MTMKEVRKGIEDSIRRLFESKDRGCTYINYLPSKDTKNVWAVVSAWLDYDNNGDWRLYSKVAYQPTNSLMQEYDIDWLMPVEEKTGFVWDTELAIAPNTIGEDVGWLLREWAKVSKAREIAA